MYNFSFKRQDAIEGKNHAFVASVDVGSCWTNYILDHQYNLVTAVNTYLDEITGSYNKTLKEIENLPLPKFKPGVNFFSDIVKITEDDDHYIRSSERYFVKYSDIVKYYTWDPSYDIGSLDTLDSNAKFIDILIKVFIRDNDNFTFIRKET